MVRLLGPRTPRVLSLLRLKDVMTPATRTTSEPGRDPFDIGDLRTTPDDLDPAVLAAVQDILDHVTEPTRLSTLLDNLRHADFLGDLAAPAARLVPWTLAVTVASAYGGFHGSDDDLLPAADAFLTGRLAVVRPGTRLAAAGITGDDLILIPRPR
jgi:hypothetical protein